MSSYLQIALKHHIYGLPIDLVEEILLLPEITPIPDSPSDIIGIANLRGKALPVIHLAKRLGISEIRCQITDNLVVINIATTLVGIVVEAVMGIIEIASGDIDRLINDFIPPLSNFLSGVGKIGDRLLPLINPNTLVRSPLEVSTISEVDPTKVLGDFYSCFAPNASLQEREIFYQRRLSLSQVVQIQTTATLSLVVTEIDQEIIAFPSKQVRECLIIDPPTPIPFSPSFVVGTVNIRSEVFTIFNIQALLGLNATNHLKSKAIIIHNDKYKLGFLIDHLRGISDIDPTRLNFSQSAKIGIMGTTVIDGRLATVIDLLKVIDNFS